jgi:hypothetical protein
MRNDDPTRAIGYVPPSARYLSREDVLRGVQGFIGEAFTGGILIGEG